MTMGPADVGETAALWAGDPTDDMRAALASAGVAVQTASGPDNVLDRLEFGPFSVAIIECDPDRERSVQMLGNLAERFPDVSLVVLAPPDEALSLDLLRAGASDVIGVPAEPSDVLLAVSKAVAARARASEEPPPSINKDRVLLGQSKPMLHVRDLIRRACSGNATVLIRGESGTGKELVAREIHAQSPRARGPFVKIHCAALPDTLLESELFGHEKGAFTGATTRKEGRVEVAEGGTLFLDEIGDITPAMQVKLLRLLQDREYERLGSTRTRTADVRFLAATHRALENMVSSGEFREDLFYRLNVIPLWLPPLRARRDDIDLLAKTFCATYGKANGRPGIKLTQDALDFMHVQRWPGNVRQLQNFVERLVVLTESDVITRAHVEAELHQATPFATQATEPQTRGSAAGPATESGEGKNHVLPLSDELRVAEKRALERALKAAKGNRTLAARILGVSRATLYAKLQQHGVS